MMYCEQSPSETIIHFQSDLFNDTVSAEYLCEIAMCETEWGVDGEGGRERKRAAD